MARRRKSLPQYQNVEIIDAGSEGKAVAKVDEKVIFVPFVVPGDVCDIKVVKKKKSYLEGRALKIHSYSDKRTEPLCEHYGYCGGCKWQNMDYRHQLYYKQKQVEDNLQRIGKITLPEITPIIPSEDIFYYRNKLEYTFSNRRWFIDPGQIPEDEKQLNGLGFHLPGMFDKILDINKCHLQADPSNDIRLKVKKYAVENGLSFYDVRSWTGLLRNLVIRNTSTGELMVIVVFSKDDKKAIEGLMDYIHKEFPRINALMYVINEKRNDDISDLEIRLFEGRPYIIEEIPVHKKEGSVLKFKIGPVSFFQTNSRQANTLYTTAIDFADLTRDEVVYDLYTGTGTIANYVAGLVSRVIGIEYVPSAIEDAKENSEMNNIRNTDFYAGDIIDVLNDELVERHGRPDLIITDPPRAGMHAKVVNKILDIAPLRIVYISCNPATQARDMSLLNEKYSVEKIQPVDMFPHTSHVENVVLLKKRCFEF